MNPSMYSSLTAYMKQGDEYPHMTLSVHNSGSRSQRKILCMFSTSLIAQDAYSTTGTRGRDSEHRKP